jgi:hypothetical protein
MVSRWFLQTYCKKGVAPLQLYGANILQMFLEVTQYPLSSASEDTIINILWANYERVLATLWQIRVICKSCWCPLRNLSEGCQHSLKSSNKLRYQYRVPSGSLLQIRHKVANDLWNIGKSVSPIILQRDYFSAIHGNMGTVLVSLKNMLTSDTLVLKAFFISNPLLACFNYVCAVTKKRKDIITLSF